MLLQKFLRFLGTFFKKFLSGVWGNAPRQKMLFLQVRSVDTL